MSEPGGVAHAPCADSLFEAFAHEYRPTDSTPGLPNGHLTSAESVPELGRMGQIMFVQEMSSKGVISGGRKQADRSVLESDQRQDSHGLGRTQAEEKNNDRETGVRQ